MNSNVLHDFQIFTLRKIEKKIFSIVTIYLTVEKMSVLTYDIKRIWELLDEVNDHACIYWKERFSGPPSYFTIFKFVESENLEQLNPYLYKQLKEQFDFNNQYEYDNYESLR